jgi:hypothetical protein
MVALAAALVLLAAACGNDDQGTSSASAPPTEPGAATPLDYDQSTDGLRRLLEDLLDAVRADDRTKIDRLTGSLQLEDPKAWFNDIFGNELGDKLTADYQEVAGAFGQLESLFDGLLEAGQTNVAVERFHEAGDPNATGYQNLALAAMRNNSPLYSARFTADDQAAGFHLWSFVYDGGGFRWVGKLKAVYSGKRSDPDLLELRARLAEQASAKKSK